MDVIRWVGMNRLAAAFPLLVGIGLLLLVLGASQRQGALTILYTSSMRGQMTPSSMSDEAYVVNPIRGIEIPRLGDLWDVADRVQRLRARQDLLLVDAG